MTGALNGEGYTRRTALQADGSLVIGGNYTAYNGTLATRLICLTATGSVNNTATPVAGATFTFSPGNTTTNPLVTSAAGSYSAVASLNGEASAPSNAVTLTACASPPSVTALSASAELPGLTLTLTGTGFAAGSTVTFGGVAAGSVTVNSLTSLTATVPASAVAGTSPIVVSTANGSSLTAPAFQVPAVYDGGALGV